MLPHASNKPQNGTPGRAEPASLAHNWTQGASTVPGHRGHLTPVFKEGWRPLGSTHQGTGPTPASRLLHHTRGGNPQETVEAGLSDKDTKGRSQASAGSRGLAGDKHPHAGSRRCQRELWLIIYPVPWTANSHGCRPSPGAS